MGLSTNLLLLFFLSPLAVWSYDIGCIYPRDMPDPFDVELEIVTTLSLLTQSRGLETPLIIHAATAAGGCLSNCNAYHDPTALNALTQRATPFATPPSGHNSFSRALCYAACMDAITSTRGARNPLLVTLFDTWGLRVTPVDRELALLLRSQDADALGAFLARKDFHPFLIGQIVAGEIGAFFRDDG